MNTTAVICIALLILFGLGFYIRNLILNPQGENEKAEKVDLPKNPHLSAMAKEFNKLFDYQLDPRRNPLFIKEKSEGLARKRYKSHGDLAATPFDLFWRPVVLGIITVNELHNPTDDVVARVYDAKKPVMNADDHLFNSLNRSSALLLHERVITMENDEVKRRDAQQNDSGNSTLVITGSSHHSSSGGGGDGGDGGD